MDAIVQNSTRKLERITTLEGMRLHFDHAEEDSYLFNHFAYYDPTLNLFFFNPSGCCCNLTPLKEIPLRYHQAFLRGRTTGNECYHGASHEQYTFPYYHNYIPDHLQRIEAAVRALTQEGQCKPVFYSQGLLGNTAWGD